MQLNALGSILFAAAADTAGIPQQEHGESIDAFVERVSVDAIMKHDFSRAVDAANAGNQSALAGCLHSVAVWFEPRDAPIKRRERDLTPGA